LTRVIICGGGGGDGGGKSGEIEYRYIFSLLEKLGYNDWIELEYRPANNTKEGL
jgi:hydroxypyruvate isomerase